MGRRGRQNKKIPDPLLPGKGQLPHWGRRVRDFFSDSSPTTSTPPPAPSNSLSPYQFVEYEPPSESSSSASTRGTRNAGESHTTSQFNSIDTPYWENRRRSSSNSTLEHLTTRRSFRSRRARPLRSATSDYVTNSEVPPPPPPHSSSGPNSPYTHATSLALPDAIINNDSDASSPPSSSQETRYDPSRARIQRSLSHTGFLNSHPRSTIYSGVVQETLFSPSGNYSEAHSTQYYQSAPLSSASSLAVSHHRALDETYNASLPVVSASQLSQSRMHSPSYGASSTSSTSSTPPSIIPVESNALGITLYTSAAQRSSPIPYEQHPNDNMIQSTASFPTSLPNPYDTLAENYSFPSQSPPLSMLPPNTPMPTTYGTRSWEHSAMNTTVTTLPTSHTLQSDHVYDSSFGNNQNMSREGIPFPSPSYPNDSGLYAFQEPMPPGLVDQASSRGTTHRDYPRARTAPTSELHNALVPRPTMTSRSSPSSAWTHTRGWTYPPTHPAYQHNINPGPSMDPHYNFDLDPSFPKYL